MTKPNYEIVISQETLYKIQKYHQELIEHKEIVGIRLANNLKLYDKDIKDITTEEFIDALVNTKAYITFAESANTDKEWNSTEVHILGDVGIIMPNVKIFDNGAYGGAQIKNYDKPLDGGLLFIPGALLDNKISGNDSDVAELVKDGQINQTAYNKFIERKLLPLFVAADKEVAAEGKTAEINIPNLGGGSFAGKFKGYVGKYTNHAIKAMLEKHADHLQHISYVRLATGDSKAETQQIGSIKYEVKGSAGVIGKPIFSLSHSKTSLTNTNLEVKLFKVVASDHKAWPCNDFFHNIRFTDEGMSAAATNAMEILTGVRGAYDNLSHRYLAPESKIWEQVAINNRVYLQVKGNIRVVSHDGKSSSLEDIVVKQELLDTPIVQIIEPTKNVVLLDKNLHLDRAINTNNKIEHKHIQSIDTVLGKLSVKEIVFLRNHNLNAEDFINFKNELNGVTVEDFLSVQE